MRRCKYYTRQQLNVYLAHHQWDAQKGNYTLNINKDAFKNAPTFSSDNWPVEPNSAWVDFYPSAGHQRGVRRDGQGKRMAMRAKFYDHWVCRCREVNATSRKAYKTNRKFLLPIFMSDFTVRHSDRAIPLNRKVNCVMQFGGTVLEVDLDIRG